MKENQEEFLDTDDGLALAKRVISVIIPLILVIIIPLMLVIIILR